jgi:hypothetical protein
MVGIKCWEPDDGRTELEHIKEVLLPIRSLIGLQGLLYGSRDFKKEIDVQGLTRYKEACENAMHKDNRGGHLGQEGVEAWTRDVYEDVMYTAAMDRMAAMVQKSMSQYIIDISYGIRTMFAHIREKRRIFRRWRELCPAATVDHKLHPEWMLNLYNVIRKGGPVVIQAAPPKLKCPFPHFRPLLQGDVVTAEGSAEETEEEDTNKVVFDGWDQYRYKALKRFANSKIETAIDYKRGPHGYTMAIYKDGSETQLEIPNARCVNGMIRVTAPVDASMQSGGGNGPEADTGGGNQIADWWQASIKKAAAKAKARAKKEAKKAAKLAAQAEVEQKKKEKKAAMKVQQKPAVEAIPTVEQLVAAEEKKRRMLAKKPAAEARPAVENSNFYRPNLVAIMGSAADEGDKDGGADDPTPGKRKGSGADGGRRKKGKTGGSALNAIQKTMPKIESK